MQDGSFGFGFEGAVVCEALEPFCLVRLRIGLAEANI